MKKSLDVMKELKELGISIPELPAPFDIPTNYFSNLDKEILERVETESFLDSLPKSNPYHLESGYFDQLPASIVGLNFIESLPKDNVFAVPENYFDKLPEQLIRKVKQDVRIVPMRKVSPVFSRMSIAASILLILGIGFLFMQGKVNISAEQRLAQVSELDLEQYFNTHSLEFAGDLSYNYINESELDLNSLENDVINNLPLDELTPEEMNQYAF